jgi:hypothetical protein
MHEYSVVGHPREKVIFYLAFLSFLISSFVTYFTEVWMQERFNIVLSFSLSVAAIFALLYLLFNHVLWKVKLFGKLAGFPNLNGTYECTGLSYHTERQENFEWEGIVTIRQTWDKFLVSVETKTSTSRSQSIVGGLKYLPGVGFKLSYHYENVPNISSKELKKHEGFCVLTFSEGGMAANGFYFNNYKDRPTYGEMILKRGLDNGKVRLLEKAG